MRTRRSRRAPSSPLSAWTTNRIYETTNSAAFSSAKIGQKVTLHTDGLQVTATTASGVAEIVDFDDKAKSGAGGTVHVRF